MTGSIQNPALPASMKFTRVVKRIFLIPPFESVLRRLTIGKEYGTLISRFAPTHDQYPIGTIRETNFDGLRFRLDLSDLTAWFVYWGFVDRSRQNLYAMAKEGDVVFDIGANIGDVSLNLAQIVGENGTVFAFEPFHETFDQLRHNCELNTFSNIRLVEKALADTKGVLHMIQLDANNSGMNKVAPIGLDTAAGTPIEAVSLDEFVEKDPPDKIDLIKIDVEGFEMQVLRGARRSLQLFKPKLFVELGDHNLSVQQSSPRELLEFLNALGYTFRRADSGMPVSAADDLKNQHFDIVALPSA